MGDGRRCVAFSGGHLALGRLGVSVSGLVVRIGMLPVPLLAERRQVLTDVEHLAARIDLRVRRGRRTIFEGTSHLAGLEHGHVPDGSGG